MHNSLHYKLGSRLRYYITFFYSPFKKLCNEQFFVYGVCGTANTAFCWVLYWFLYNFILKKEDFSIAFITFKPHIAAFFIQFPFTFISGFWLNRYVSFSASVLKKRVQAPRYLSVIIVCIFINYFGLKLFVEILGIYPTPSQMLSTIATTIFSFFAQKHFAFKIKQ